MSQALVMIEKRGELQKPAIRVSEETKRRLEAIGRMGDTYDDVITRLLDEHESGK